jgi:hypothetical protein
MPRMSMLACSLANTGSRALCYSDELDGQGGNWVDGTASYGSG